MIGTRSIWFNRGWGTTTKQRPISRRDPIRSGEDTGRRGGLITCVRRAGRLDQQDLHFPPRYGAMLDAPGYDKNLAGVEGHRAIAQLDVKRTLEHKKEIVRVVMLVPMEWPLELGHHDVVVVVSRNGARGVAISEGCKLIGEICGCFHCVFLLCAHSPAFRRRMICTSLRPAAVTRPL